MVKAQVCSKDDAVAYLECTGFGLLATDISDQSVYLARNNLEMWLERENILFDNLEDLDDKRDFGYIWAASFCGLLEILGMLGQNQFSSGDVSMVRTGKVETMMQRWQPMFFFARGMARGFYELLPHDTYRMMMFQQLKSWKLWRFKKFSGQIPYGTRVGNLDGDGNVTFPDVMGGI